jgi:formylglycine-generating enzyme required for sulfatase activity
VGVSSTVDFKPGRPTGIERREAEAELRSPDNSLREMVLIPAGWFSMGSPGGVGKEDEHPQHQVQLSAYFMDRCAVSNEEYEKFDPNHRRMRVEESLHDEDPVIFVSYQECLDYCRWRAEQEGVPPGTYTLPSEAQWERAARGGYPDRVYPWGDTIDTEKCNTLEAGRNRTLPVAEGFANGFQLYHMGSNVREWCLDFYSETYYDRLEARGPDPRGPAATLVVRMRVVRGACYQDAAIELSRCAARNYAHPKSGTSDIGFRCVRMVRPEELQRGTKK